VPREGGLAQVLGIVDGVAVAPADTLAGEIALVDEL
jgi:hypothetical protein